MFRKLRNKFLIMNMIITSLVMISAFAVVYFTTFKGIYDDTQNKLNALSEAKLDIDIQLPNDLDGTGKREIIKRKYIFSDYFTSFSVIVNSNGEILNLDSLLDMQDEDYNKAINSALNNKTNKKPISINNKKWLYSVNKITNDKYQIVFLDVTESNETLVSLRITLFTVGFILIFFIFLVSLYFANKAINPIMEAWEKQKQFIADASHELKTPLTIINTNYDVILSNKEETIESQIKWFEYMKIGSDRITKLINDLLFMAKMDVANLETHKIDFDISSTIHNIILSMEAAIIEKNITLTSFIEPCITVKSDLEGVKQIVAILLDNAIKYTDEMGQIEITLKKSNRQIFFSIKNSGKGISPQDLPKIFDRFYRTDPSRTHKNGGYGLGLSIAETIADKLDSQIYVKSIENEYTIFYFYLNL